MNTYKGFEVVPISDFGCAGWSQVRITVSSFRVGLSRHLIAAMGNPSYITFHRGVGENEGKMIIAAAENTGEQGQIHINLDSKKIIFSKSEFSESCAEMVQTYANGSFSKGTYYSIGGAKIDDAAFVFDFHEAMEHTVKYGMRGMNIAAAGASVQRPAAFSMPQRTYNMQDRGPGVQERSSRL